MFVDDFDLVCPYVLTSQCMSTHEALIGVHVVVHSFVECAAMVYVCVIRCFMYTFSHNSSYKSSSRLRSNPCAKQACCACMEHTTTFIRMFVVCICVMPVHNARSRVSVYDESVRSAWPTAMSTRTTIADDKAPHQTFHRLSARFEWPVVYCRCCWLPVPFTRTHISRVDYIISTI